MNGVSYTGQPQAVEADPESGEEKGEADPATETSSITHERLIFWNGVAGILHLVQGIGVFVLFAAKFSGTNRDLTTTYLIYNNETKSLEQETRGLGWGV